MMIRCKNMEELMENVQRKHSDQEAAAPLNIQFQEVNIPKEAPKPPTEEPKPKQKKSNPVAEPFPYHLSLNNAPVPKKMKNTIKIIENDDSNVVELESSDEDDVIGVTLPPRTTITIESSDEEISVYDHHTSTKAKKRHAAKGNNSPNDREISASPVPSVVSSGSDEFLSGDCIAFNISSDHQANPHFDFSLPGSDVLGSAPSKKKKTMKNMERAISTPITVRSAQNKSNVEKCFATPKSKVKNKKQKNTSYSSTETSVPNDDVYYSDSNHQPIGEINLNRNSYIVSNNSLSCGDVYGTDSSPSETPRIKSNTTSNINVNTSDSSISLGKSHEETPKSGNTQSTGVKDVQADIQENVVMGNVTGFTQSDDYGEQAVVVNTPTKRKVKVINPKSGSTKVPAISHEDLDFDNLKGKKNVCKNRQYSQSTLRAEMQKGSKVFNDKQIQKKKSNVALRPPLRTRREPEAGAGATRPAPMASREIGSSNASDNVMIFDMEVTGDNTLQTVGVQRKASLPDTSGVREIGINHRQFEKTVDSWIDNIIDSDDDDIDDDDLTEGIPFPSLTPRTVHDCPTDDSGLSAKQLATLSAQEEADDRFLHDLAPSTDCFDFNWTDNRQTFTGSREAFTGTPGPTFPVKDLTPVDMFYKMFDDDFLTLLVTETNRYADRAVTRLKLDPSTSKNARALQWEKTDKDEMVAFLAVIILQGLYPKVREQSYFSFDGFGTTPYFRRIMSYNRYLLLKHFLHFIDNDLTEDRTKLNKIRPVIDYFNEKFSSLYTPRQEVAVDESLLKWLGRLSFSQKIRTKAAQMGIKTYELCESSSGYLWAFRVYTGKKGPNRPTQSEDRQDGGRLVDGTRNDSSLVNDRQDSDKQGIDRHDNDRQGDSRLVNNSDNEVWPDNATARIVYDLVEPLLHRGHTLIMDNFYNSPLLARCLKKAKTDVFGTLRLSRKFVPEELKTMTKGNMREGDVVASYCSDLAVMLWRDSNLVSMISTYHPLHEIGTSNKHNKVYKPVIVLDYNKYMGGVDRKDQFLAGQPLERVKNKVWYKKLFRRLFNAALFNCFVIYTSDATHKMTHRNFRVTLAETLLKIHRQIDLKTEPRLISPRRTTTDNTATKTTAVVATTKTSLVRKSPLRPFVKENHFPASTGSTATRCWMCSKKKTPSRTSYKCEECDVNLCIVGCFKEYHKLTN